MAKTLFLVTLSAGPAWDKSRSRDKQDGWPEHAAFMNRLAASGAIVLGGPVSDVDAVMVFDARDEAELNAWLAEDPWTQSGVLDTRSIQRWTILLEAGQDD